MIYRIPYATGGYYLIRSDNDASTRTGANRLFPLASPPGL